MNMITIRPFRCVCDSITDPSVYFMPMSERKMISRSSLSNEWIPAVDIFDRDGQIMIQMELAGIGKENVSIELDHDILTIRGDRPFEVDKSDVACFLKERRTGTFERRFRLPADIRPDSIRANYKDGLLQIEMPKSLKEPFKKVTIN